MTTSIPTAPSSGGAAVRPALFTAFQVTTGLVVLLVLIQAAMAGQALYGAGDIRLHGYVGNATFALGLVAVVLALVARVPRWLLLVTGLLLVVLFAQTGLGYAGRTSTGAASIHVPLGVTAFGLATAAAMGAILTRPR